MFIKNKIVKKNTIGTKMLSSILTGTLHGVDALPVEVEVDVSNGMPYFNLVGLGDNAVKESKVRVQTAIRNSNIKFTF